MNGFGMSRWSEATFCSPDFLYFVFLMIDLELRWSSVRTTNERSKCSKLNGSEHGYSLTSHIWNQSMHLTLLISIRFPNIFSSSTFYVFFVKESSSSCTRRFSNVEIYLMLAKRQVNRKWDKLATYFHKIFQKQPKLLPFGTSEEYEIVISSSYWVFWSLSSSRRFIDLEFHYFLRFSSHVNRLLSQIAASINI